MKKELIQEIIKNKIPCVFLSPHFDDAALSCGTLLNELSGKTELTIINIFTRAHDGPYTLSARQFLTYSGGYSNAEKLFHDRYLEDKDALSNLKVKVVNLDLQDALFRKREKGNFLSKILPEIDHVYPTYRWHITKNISAKDFALNKLKNYLKATVKKDTLVFAPYAIGNHVDHRLVRKACEDLFTDYVLYSDFPYNVRENNYGKADKNQTEYILPIDFEKKNKLIQLYKTQVTGLFAGGVVPPHEEVYFITKKV